MIGILVQLAISWLLLWLFQKENLGVLGFRPSRKRLLDFSLFFMITAVCAIAGFLLKIWIAHFRYQLNPQLDFRIILEGAWFTLKSVLFEELIFRGAILTY